MAASSLYDQGLILSYFLTQGPLSLVLCTSMPTGSETFLSSLSVAAYTGYANQTISAGSFSSQSVVSGTTIISNTSIINFPSPTANYSTPIVAFALCDSSTHLRRYGALAIPLLSLTAGQLVRIPAGQLIIAQG